jgi:amino acid adenylation domain-containing protein
MQSNTIQGFRLSPQQKRLWSLQANSSVYKSQCAVTLEGNLNIDVLKTALQEVIDKHEILRTRFCCLSGMKMPIMIVENSCTPAWEELDWTDYNTQKQIKKLDLLFQELLSQQINCEHGIFFKISLIKLNIDKHILLISLPALAADTLTLANLVQEISNHYQNFNSSEEIVQYIQFAEWQNQLLESEEEVEAGRNYWLSQDFSSLNTLHLPFESKSDDSTFSPTSFKLALAPDIANNVFLLACWQILLWHLTKQPDIIIGMATNGREYEELHNALGLFAKWLPIRCQLTADLCFNDVLKSVQEVIGNAEEWQDYFVEEYLGKDADNTIFYFGFEFLELPNIFCAGDVHFSIFQQYSCIEPFKLKLTCISNNNSLLIEFNYNQNIFTVETIERLAEEFQTLVANVVENPEIAIGKLDILSHSERHKLLVDFNDTHTEYELNKCIHHIIEEQAAKNQNKIAIIFENQQLTYAELNIRANQIAHHLQTLGVSSQVVGIYLERSLETIIAMLGILKAEAPFLALDVNLPAEAIAMRLQVAEVAIVLTQESLQTKLPENVTHVVLDKDSSTIAQQSQSNPLSQAKSDNLVYIVFTSGSTGTPKGVAIEHRQLLNYVYGILDRLSLSEDASFATVSTFAADLGNTAIFPALCSGGCLHIISTDRATDSKLLADYFQRHRIDCLKIVPSHLAALLSEADAHLILPQQRLILGGEAASWSLIEQIRQLSPQCKIINHYGPTETTVGVLTYLLNDKQTSYTTETVPLGRPLLNTQVYVLDEQLQLVPIGVPGELYIGGACLGRGYINSQELTEEKFIPHLFSNEPGARLYRTGDLARYLPDGNLEFLGRVDNQVKVRGFRIELEEIEVILSQYPQVQQAVVIVREDKPGDKRLFSYLVPKQNQELSIGELREYVQRKLPEYMLPSGFIILKKLPLTANGKVNRQALPAPDDRQLEVVSFVAPRSPAEEVLAGIWALILGIKQVGIHDNFFALGGHSLLATQVISRIRKVFNIDLPLRQLFETPTVAEIGAYVETAISTGTAPIFTSIPKARDKQLPLSFAQQRLWFLDQFNPKSPFYNLPHAVRFTGNLNVDAFHTSINEIVRRHEALRTHFISVEGEPVQQIVASIYIPLRVVDLRSLPEAIREDEARQLAISEAKTGFDLSTDALLRVTLLRIAEEEYIVLFTMHHIVSDGWSTGVLIRELVELYEAFILSKPSPLPELTIQYADFAVWQREWLQGQVLETEINYWQSQLKNLPVLELPTDRPRPPVQTFQGATQSVILPKQLTQALKKLSQQQSVTLFMTLLAAFKTLLYRYSAAEDISVGTPIANRTHSDIEPLIGFFVNTLVLRSDLSGNPKFSELLQRIREVTLEGYAHQHLPFEKLVEGLNIDRHLSHAPLFQVMFVLENAPMPELKLPGLTLTPLESYSSSAKFDLTLYMVDTEDGLGASLEYNTDLFNRDTIIRMLGHYQTLLESIITNPEQPIQQLLLLSTSEKATLEAWQLLECYYPQGKCLHQLFETQVELYPDAIALVFEEQHLSYRELNQRANQLAHHLQTLGVENQAIGLYVERSIEMVIAILAILKVGAAYVPIDPTYPEQRLEFILQDAQIQLLLTQSQLVDKVEKVQPNPLTPFPAREGGTSHSPLLVGEGLGERFLTCGEKSTSTQVLTLDTFFASNPQLSVENLNLEVTANNTAYIIYTSGSTGTPKGVLCTHYNVVRLFEATRAWFNFNNQDVWTLFHSIAFDFSVWELWGALLHGGKTVIVPYWVSRSPEEFYELLSNQQVTVLNQTPSAFRQLMRVSETLGDKKDLNLRYCIFGGEALELQSLKPWLDRYGDESPQLINMYGITETTVHVTYRRITSSDISNHSLSVIGRPIPDLLLLILDEHQQRVPIGILGEMYVGGAGVARGYLNRPELTASKFISHPLSNNSSNYPSAPVYRTGDLARYLPNGDIEYLGRIDNQVKIRGFRIELGEIEGVLATHPDVSEVAVIVREDIPQEKRIVAYVVPRPKHREALTTNLRDFLQQKLPDYMAPWVFVILDTLPLTPNGKLDRRALPMPQIESKFTPPETTAQEVIVDIWKQLLNLESVGIQDNFFELGGHSLLATQITSRLSKIFHIEFPIRRLFEAPTVEGLVEALAQIGNGRENIERIAQEFQAQQQVNSVQAEVIPRRKESSICPLSFAQTRLWFLNQLEPNGFAYNIFAPLRLKGVLNTNALQQSLNEILRRHEILRTSFNVVDGQPMQIIAPALTLTIPVVDLQHLPASQQEAEVQRLKLSEAQSPFDLRQAPLVRVTLLKLQETEHVLLFTMHHIISDGWSMGVLVKELTTLYQSYSTGEPSPLTELAIQYADFTIWQRRRLQSSVQSQLDYWQQQLAGISPLQLPTDLKRPNIQTFLGATKSFSLSKELTAALKALSRQQDVTLFMTLLAAFKVLLYRYSGQDDIAIGSPIANRNQETEALIGFFVNTLVLRTNLASNLNFEQLLKQVREMTLSAYTHQDLPFEYLVEKLQPERSLDRNPLFQVMFALQNLPTEELKLPGLSFSFLECNRQSTMLDLSLTMQESGSQLLGSWEYNTDIFDADTIERMVEHFCILLEGIVANPQQDIKALPLLSLAEQRQILVDWNNTNNDFPINYCIHELFSAQAKQTPDAIAVICGNSYLTYSQLDDRANLLAPHLQKLGVAPDVLVGVCVEKSLDMAVGIIAILKAGGAYVPLEPQLPQERLAYIIEDANLSLILTQTQLVSKLSSHQAKLICLDSDWMVNHDDSANQQYLTNGATPENLAYVIYTSGSTGKPKGVLVSHRALVNHSLAVAQAYQVQPQDKVLQFASISFDVATEEIFSSWLSGATVVIRNEQILSFTNFQQFLSQEKITVLNLPTAYWHEWVSYLARTKTSLPSTVRLVIVGTEQASTEKLAIWQEIAGNNVQWLNAYGPTEATIGVTIYEPNTQANKTQYSTWVPVGRPIANTQIYILDQNLNPVPIGVPGELYIGGVSLARGYLNQPELTSEKFIPNPFKLTSPPTPLLPGEGSRYTPPSLEGKGVGGLGSENNTELNRLYKTGDLARYLPSGDIELLGRIDDQVKIRGFRIELGEIEAQLNQHPDVQESVVRLWQDENGEKRLFAYVASDKNETLIASELRNFLTEKIPQYMLPAAFIILTELPRTANGKVNRQALSAPQIQRPESVACVMPQTDLEKTVAQVWKNALNLEQVGINDNFFELGGHSLLLAQVHSQLAEIITDISILDMFRYPTIKLLAEHFNQLQNNASPQLTDVATEKIATGKAQQRKRLQKTKNNNI